jgi:hypothetical protein
LRTIVIAIAITSSLLAQPAEVRLLEIKRVYVDMLNGGESAVQMHDLLIVALQATKLFAITEDPAKADTVMRGSASDEVFDDTFSSSDNLNVRVSGGGSGGNSSASNKGLAQVLRAPDLSAGQNESTHISERKHEAIATVRLVNKDGDVLWAATKESIGAKFRGSSADVADKIAKQLVADFEKARKPVTTK